MRDNTNFSNFINLIIDGVRECLPEAYLNAEITTQETVKNNGLVLTGLLIKKSNSNVTPLIYLDGFYESWERGESIKCILRDIVELQLEHEKQMFDGSMITDFDKAKEFIIPCVVGTENNKDLLTNKVYTEFLDLAVIYKVIVNVDSNGIAATTVTNNLLNSWGVTVEELHKIAVENLPRLQAIEVKTMFDTLVELMPTREEVEMLEEIKNSDNTMLILTNHSRLNGANAFLDTKTLKAVYSSFGGDFFIIPSSVHELIVVPATMGDSYSLRCMVKEVNDTQLEREDLLSYKVYYFDGEKVTIAE